MKQTTKVICPYCDKTQKEDIYDLTEGSDMENEFKISCDNCYRDFKVAFEFRPFVSVSKK